MIGKHKNCFRSSPVTCHSSLPSECGFTLLEVLVALTILGMAIVVIIQLASANTRSITKTDAYTKSVLKADAKMSEFMDRTDLTEGQWTEQTEDGYRHPLFR